MIKVTALIDGSIYSQSVCDHAAWAAVKKGASVDLMHVIGRRDAASAPSNLSGNIGLGARTALLEELAELDAQKAKLSTKRGRLIIEDATARLKAAGVKEITPVLRSGDLLETVAEYEKGTDLIVIGKRGEAADFAKLHLGSNLERVARASTKPVLVASRAFKPITSFLIAFDGGQSAMKAVDHISRSHLFAGLLCQLLTVGNDTPDARKAIENAKAQLEAAGYSVKSDIMAGQPDKLIPQKLAEDGIGLLVMGAYSHSRMRSLIIGSTTTEMIRSSLVPVMLFR